MGPRALAPSGCASALGGQTHRYRGRGLRLPERMQPQHPKDPGQPHGAFGPDDRSDLVGNSSGRAGAQTCNDFLIRLFRAN